MFVANETGVLSQNMSFPDPNQVSLVPKHSTGWLVVGWLHHCLFMG